MYFVIFGTDEPGTGQQRRDTMNDLASYLWDRPGHPDVTLHCAGPTLDEEGNINGTFNLIEAPSHEVAKAFLADNPLQKMNLLQDVSIRQLDWKIGRPD